MSSLAPSVHRPPHQTAPRSGTRRWSAVLSTLLLGLLLSTLGAVLGATPAAAHDTIEGSNPADGATVATVPALVSLTFDEQPQNFSPVIQVTGPDGADWADGQPTVSGTDVSVPVRAGAPAGAYTVAYRIVSSDGHPVTGELTFTAEAPAGGAVPQVSDIAPTATTDPEPSAPTVAPTTTASASTASPTATPSSPAGTTSSAPAGAPTSTDAVAPAASSSDSGSGVSGWIIALVVVALAVGVGIAVVLVRRAQAGRSVG